MLGRLEEKGYNEVGNFVTGAIFMLGLMTIIINSGLYYEYCLMFPCSISAAMFPI